MTLDQTRQLEIEFERRVQTMYAQEEIIDKLDTETIESFLNLYLLDYVIQLSSLTDQATSNTKGSIKISDALSTLYTNTTLTVTNDEATIPTDYLLYIKSSSIVSSTYKYKPGSILGTHHNRLTNSVLKDLDLQLIAEKLYNSGNIMRHPGIVIANGKFILMHDVYTTITNLDLTYYKQPLNIDFINEKACELPYSCFNDLVNGAVSLYMTYKTNVDLMKNDAKKKALANLTQGKEDDK